MPRIVSHLESMQYTGTNGPDIVTWLNGSAELGSDDGENLTVRYCGSDFTVAAGGYVIGGGTNHSFYAMADPDSYAVAWIELPDAF
jgi:hypothetical protein